MIDLYYWPTPNGHKITLFLEEAAWTIAFIPSTSAPAISLSRSFSPSHRTTECPGDYRQ
jgi:hypothetical protein